jgi:hypothetical protein
VRWFTAARAIRAWPPPHPLQVEKPTLLADLLVTAGSN